MLGGKLVTRRNWLVVMAWGLLVAVPSPIQAQPPPLAGMASATVTLQPDGRVVVITGHFVGDVAERLEKLLAAVPSIRTVRLESRGGFFMIGATINRLIRDKNLTTEVLGVCASACTMAFLGGVQRLAGPQARFGFHGALLHPEMTQPSAARSMAGNLIMRGLYLHAGLQEAFVDRILALPVETPWWPSHAELRAVGFLLATPRPR